MRLTRVAKPFDDPDYIFELKHDGFCAIAYIENSECKLVSRNSNQFKSLVSLKESLGKIPVKNAILDGEVVCLDEHGVSKFNELMSRKGKPVFYAFDLLWLDDKDLRSLPLIERKQRLHELIPEKRLSAHHLRAAHRRPRRRILPGNLRAGFGRHRKNNGLGWKKIKNPNYSQAEGRHDLFKRTRER